MTRSARAGALRAARVDFWPHTGSVSPTSSVPALSLARHLQQLTALLGAAAHCLHRSCARKDAPVVADAAPPVAERVASCGNWTFLQIVYTHESPAASPERDAQNQSRILCCRSLSDVQTEAFDTIRHPH